MKCQRDITLVSSKQQHIPSSCIRTLRNPHPDSEPKPHFHLNQIQQIRMMYQAQGVLHRLPSQRSSTHLPKISSLSCIWISTCCCGNRHPALPARLVWPQFALRWSQKQKKEDSRLFYFFSQCNTTRFCWLFVWKKTSVAETWVESGCTDKAISAQSTVLIRNSMPHSVLK